MNNRKGLSGIRFLLVYFAIALGGPPLIAWIWSLLSSSLTYQQTYTRVCLVYIFIVYFATRL